MIHFSTRSKLLKHLITFFPSQTATHLRQDSSEIMTHTFNTSEDPIQFQTMILHPPGYPRQKNKTGKKLLAPDYVNLPQKNKIIPKIDPFTRIPQRNPGYWKTICIVLKTKMALFIRDTSVLLKTVPLPLCLPKYFSCFLAVRLSGSMAIWLSGFLAIWLSWLSSYLALWLSDSLVLALWLWLCRFRFLFWRKLNFPLLKHHIELI